MSILAFPVIKGKLPMEINVEHRGNLSGFQLNLLVCFFIQKLLSILLIPHISQNKPMERMMKWRMFEFNIMKIIRIQIHSLYPFDIADLPGRKSSRLLTHQLIDFSAERCYDGARVLLNLVISLGAHSAFGCAQNTTMRGCEDEWTINRNYLFIIDTWRNNMLVETIGCFLYR